MRYSLILLAAVALAQSPAPAPAKPEPPKFALPAAPIAKDHALAAGLKYKSQTGLMALKNDAGDHEANLFYVAYTTDAAAKQKRPVTFCFNGGPGAGSLWLHLGAIGPKRAPMLEDGTMPPPPYAVVDNPDTWLDRSDLVFVDPVGTGYSRAKSPDVAKKFYSLNGDIASIGNFIRQWLTENERWGSPLFIAGESYGTTRAAGLSNHLAEKGINLNGVFLISTILNFQTARFARGNDLPYAVFLPTYTAIAHYHKKLPPDLQSSLEKAVAESRRYAGGDYQSVLYKGDSLGTDERKKAVAQLARLTGLSPQFLERTDMRIEIQRFCKELLRDKGLTVGRLDGRLTGAGEGTASAETPEFDPSLTAIRGPYTAAMNQYARETLGFDTDLEYYALGSLSSQWDFEVTTGSFRQGFADTSTALRSAMAKNPYMKVFVASGYYDLATPFEAAYYTVNHMDLDPKLRANVQFAEYEAGHMMYIHVPSLKKLKKDVDGFYASALR